MNTLHAVWTWSATHWGTILIAVAIVGKVLNKITARYADKKGLVRFLLMVIDILDLVKLSPPPGVGLAAKPGSKTPLLPCLLLALAFVGSGCLTTQKALDAVSAASAGARQAAAVVLDTQCSESAKACTGNVPDKCPAWVTCRDRRRAVYALDEVVQVTAKQGLALLAAGSSVGVDTIIANAQALLARLVRVISAYGLTAVPAAPGGAL